MQRVVEPELMDGTEQAEAYARADFSEPNAAFCDHLAELLSPPPKRARVLDLGTGPADIPIRLARRFDSWAFEAVDGSAAMLAHASNAVRAAGLDGRIRLIHAVLPSTELGKGFDVILSNSLLHHLHDPTVLWRSVTSAARPGAVVLVMDLRRPDSTDAARALVDLHAAREPEVLRRDFHNSLLAAYTPVEVERQLVDHGLNLEVRATSDRHLIVRGTLD